MNFDELNDTQPVMMYLQPVMMYLQPVVTDCAIKNHLCLGSVCLSWWTLLVSHNSLGVVYQSVESEPARSSRWTVVLLN